MLLEEKYKAYFEEGQLDKVLELFEAGHLSLEVALRETGTTSKEELKQLIQERKMSKNNKMCQK